MAQSVRWGEFWYLYGRVIRQMKKGVLWLPLLLQAILMLAAAMIHYYVFSPITGGLVTAWAQVVDAEYASQLTHYPGHFVLLPYFFGYARLVLNIVTEAFLFGILIDMLLALYWGKKPVFVVSFKLALKRYLKLALAWGIVIAVLYVINQYFNNFLESVVGFSLQGAPRRQFMADVVLRVITILVYAPCIFLLPSIMAGGVSFGRAIGRGLRMALRHPFVAIGLVLIPYLIGLLPSWGTSQSASVVANFSPVLVYYLVLISIVVDMIVNFLLVGTSVKFFMDQIE